MRIARVLLPALGIACLLSSLSSAATPDQISGAIDSSKVVALTGHVTPMARPQDDRGPVEPSRKLRMSMLLMPTAAQQQAMDQLLAEQQDRKSPNFHKWLTADQFGERFGPSQGDMEKITAWLVGQGFKITYVAHGRDYVSFEGNAAQVESVFRTTLHNFNVKGQMHFANTTPPMIPAALGGIVGGFRGMHDFFPRAMHKPAPDYTVSGFSTHFLAPGDLATIYDINPLYNGLPKIDGTGQKIVIAGQSDVYLADLHNYRTAFGISDITGCTVDGAGVIRAGACSSGNFQMVVPGDGVDPGVSAGNLGESDLDIEVVSAVARGAEIIFVTSGTNAGVDDSASWAIDQIPPLAPVISYSYGLCEAYVTAPNITASEITAKKGAMEGVSFFAASGDAAAATCDGDNGTYPAELGLSVSYPASSQYVTGVGGTEFDEGSGTYWNAGNTIPGDGGSAIKYIPETAWNDSGVLGTLDGTGGGSSNCASGSKTVPENGFNFEVCNAPPAGGFPKPSWQMLITTLSDSVRDVPDISFSASNVNDPYIVCLPQSELIHNGVSSSSCANGITSALTSFANPSAFGGTSASTPVAAGMAVLLNQYLNANGLGSINQELYTLYKNNPPPAGPFHDVVGGINSITGGSSDNIVQCFSGTPAITGFPAALQCPGGGSFGYVAGTGYDAVTGVGSLDIDALFKVWGASRTSTTTTISPSATNVNAGTSVTFTATVTPSSATGTVNFYDNGSTTALGTGALSSGTATFSTSTLPTGSNSVTATYGGDATDGVSTSVIPAVVTVVQADFTLGANPGSATVTAGHTSGTITVTVTPVLNFNSQVTFTCPGALSGVACNFNPAMVTPDGVHAITTNLTITTLPSTATGATPVTVSATGGGVTHTANVNLTVNATDQSFTLAAGQGGTYTVTQGQTANVTVTVTPTNGFNAALTYTCPDTVSESTCLGPSSPTNMTTVSFMVTTTAPTMSRASSQKTRVFYALLLPGLLGIVFVGGSRKRSPGGMRLLGLIVVLGLSTLWLGSCGGSGGSTPNPGTPKGNYTITINATTGGASPVTNNTTFMLVVQ